MTLVEFLLARITEDEQAANATLNDPVMPWSQQDWAEIDQPALGHVDRWSPARVLAECAAKRGIIRQWTGLEPDAEDLVLQADLLAKRFDRATDETRTGLVWAWTAALLLLAEPYAYHPDYDPAWKPVA